ncbi:MAG: hypothetical protein PHY73_00970 [Candidatus Omnitrophica bacterium]|nr:hypothetical protein [Candidatus Omnitrophota bacterium]
MKYGHFSKDNLEYIVTAPETPYPWINYLTNETYCSIISQCAGGYSFYRDCRTNRVTRWHPEDYHLDRPGKYIFVREDKKAYSLTYQPLRAKPSYYACHHGLGYTSIDAVNRGLKSNVTYFVPEKDHCEVWIATLTNQTKKTKNLEVFPYVEFLIGDYHEELRYRNIMNLYNRVWFDKKEKAIFAKKTAQWQGMNIQPFSSQIFFASSLNVVSVCTQKEAFLGRYNNEEKPDAVLKENGFKDFPVCSGEDGIGSFKHVISLKPGETKEFTIVLGQTEKMSDIKRILKNYKKVSYAKAQLKKTKKIWQDRIIDNIEIKTPDKDFDTMANVWLKYQTYICNLWSRSPSFFHEGSGGRGYRDSCQDSEAIVSINSELAKNKIFKIASLIRRDGTSAPGWSETDGPHKFLPNKDHQIWLTTTVCAYVKETGDKAILSTKLPYLKDRWIKGWKIDTSWKGGAKQDGEGTLLEHLEANLTFCFNDVGVKGFPKIGHADWNDAIDAAGIKHKGESVWLAQALVRSLRILAELCDFIGDQNKKNKYLKMADVMDARVNEKGWDGQWYVRGFDDNGQVYGTKKDKEGKIFLNAQSWAVLSGIAKKDRLKKVLDSVDKHLNGPHGLALFAPAYSFWVKRLGRISMFSEGTKENAAVFCHAATFMAVAYAMSGCGDKAYEAIKKIMPNKQEDMELYRTEPYVFAEYLVGPQNPYRYGEGAFTWITGTAGWNFMAATEWILGVRRDFNGLRIDPSIPCSWKKCFVRRPFRGSIYEIEIQNLNGKQSGVKQITVDGKEIEGNILPVFADKKTHKVIVTLG